MKALVDSKIITLISLTIFLCGCRDHYSSTDFRPAALALHTDFDYWVSHGHPADFQPSQVAGTAQDFFIYTNVIKTTNAIFHCRFGARLAVLPPGVLAITDDSMVIFISDKDGKVTISPEMNGVNP